MSVYFTDRDLGLQFPKILQDAGLMVERHRDRFEPEVYRASPAELEKNSSAPGHVVLWVEA